MNKIKTLSLIIAFVMMSVMLNAQFHVAGIAGYSVNNKSVTGEASIGYDLKVIDVQAGFISHLSQAVVNGTLFNVRIGHSFNINEDWSIQPAIGGVYNMRSNDDKSLNVGSVLYSLSGFKNIGSDAQLVLQAAYTHKNNILVLGVGVKWMAWRDYD